MKSSINTIWQLPDLTTGFDGGTGRSADDHLTWARLVREIADKGVQNGWTKAEMARRINMPDGTFSQWFSGKYNGRMDTQNQLIENWLETVAEAEETNQTAPVKPGYFQTNFSNEVWGTLAVAQVMSELVMITAGAGVGKTMTAQAYVGRHTRAHIVTMHESIRSVHSMLQHIAAALDITENSAARLPRAIGEKLKRVGNGTLLIIDEAQQLSDEAVNQLRYFSDVYGCGIALMGNMEIYRRFSTSWLTGGKYGQLARRFLRRVKRDRPVEEDILAYIAAWGVTDEKQIKFLTGIGNKPGTLGQIEKTMVVARMLATGHGRPLTLTDLHQAWDNRNVEA